MPVKKKKANYLLKIKPKIVENVKNGYTKRGTARLFRVSEGFVRKVVKDVDNFLYK